MSAQPTLPAQFAAQQAVAGELPPPMSDADLLSASNAVLADLGAINDAGLLKLSDELLGLPPPFDRREQIVHRLMVADAERLAIQSDGWDDMDDVAKLTRLNDNRIQFYLPPVDTVPSERGFTDTAREEFFTGEGLFRKIGFVGVGPEFYDLGRVMVASSHAENGEETDEDMEILTDFYEQMVAQQRGRSWGAMAVDIFAGSIPFAQEILVSAGMGTLVKKGGLRLAREAGETAAGKGVEKLIGRMVGKMVEKEAAKRGVVRVAATAVARRAGGIGVETAARLPAFSHRIVLDKLQGQVPGFTLTATDADDIDFMIDPMQPGDDFWSAVGWGKAVASVGIEVYSEMTGKALGELGGAARKAVGKTPMRVPLDRLTEAKTRILTQIMGKRGITKLADARRLFEKMGYHGWVEELGEERVGEIMRALTPGLEATDAETFGEWVNQVTAEGAAFAMPALGQMTLAKTWKAPIAALTKRDLLTQKGASRWVLRKPEEAKAIVAKLEETGSVPARGPFETIAAREAGESWSKEERTQFGQLLSRALLRRPVVPEAKEIPDAQEGARKADETGPQEGVERGAGEEVRLRNAVEGQESDQEKAAVIEAEADLDPSIAEFSNQPDIVPATKAEESPKPEGGKPLDELTRPVWQPERLLRPTITPDAIDVASETQDLEDDADRMVDMWLADRHEQETSADIDMGLKQSQFLEILGKKRFDVEAQQTLAALQLYMDRQGREESVAEFRDQVKNETDREALTLSDHLPRAVRDFGHQLLQENEQTGRVAVQADVIGQVEHHYTARMYEAPKKKKQKRGGAEVAKFTLSTARAKRRKLGSIVEGLARGHRLQVTDPMLAQQISRKQVSQVIQDRNFLAVGKKLGFFTTNPFGKKDWKEVKHIRDWTYRGDIPEIDPSVPIIPGHWVRPKDRDNIGRVEDVDKDTAEAEVFFRNNTTGLEETITMPLDQLEGRVVRPSGPGMYITQDGRVMQQLPVFAPPELARDLNAILGVSHLYGLWGVTKLTRGNAILKRVVLFTSLFHHQAFFRSRMLGGRGFLPKILGGKVGVLGYRDGRRAIEQFGPDARELVRGGLTLGKLQDWDELLLHDTGVIGDRINHLPVAGPIKQKIGVLMDQQARFLFGTLGANLKMQTALLEYEGMLRKHAADIESGRLTRHEIAKMIANLINDDFGGLNLQRMKRDPTGQHIFRLVALAPDWTESNLRTMAKAFAFGGAAERAMYQISWGRIAIKGLGATVAFNMVMATMPGTDDEDEDLSVVGRFLDRYQKAWQTGNLRWLDIDITPLFRQWNKLWGNDTPGRKYFSVIGHFRDPLKFLTHPIRSAKHKSSVVGSMAMEAVTGQDWAGREFTTLSELLGIDDKGFYSSTSRKHGYRMGEPKGGKLAGKTVIWGKGGPIEFEQVPSYLISQIKGGTPIQAQAAADFLAGEIDGFDALSRALGIMTFDAGPTRPGGPEARAMLVKARVLGQPVPRKRAEDGTSAAELRRMRKADIAETREWIQRQGIDVLDMKEMYWKYLDEHYPKRSQSETRAAYKRRFLAQTKGL